MSWIDEACVHWSAHAKQRLTNSSRLHRWLKSCAYDFARLEPKGLRSRKVEGTFTKNRPSTLISWAAAREPTDGRAGGWIDGPAHGRTYGRRKDGRGDGRTGARADATSTHPSTIQRTARPTPIGWNNQRNAAIKVDATILLPLDPHAPQDLKFKIIQTLVSCFNTLKINKTKLRY